MGPRLLGTIRGRVSRRSVALNPRIWLAIAGFFALLGLSCLVIAAAIPPFQRVSVALVGAGLLGVGAFLFRQPAPEADSVLPHVAVVAISVMTSLAMFAFAPYSSAPLPAAVFVGVVASVWLDRPSQILAHYVLAIVLLSLPLVVGVADASTLLAAILVIPPSFVLGFCCRVVLDAATAEGNRLQELAMRDPLTGAGNRRLLDEQLDVELERHRANRRPLSVLALDLNGFKAVNDTLGHAAGDRVLVDAAHRMTEVVPPRAAVSRLGGDEFAIVLPGTGRRRAADIAAQVQRALGPAIRTGIGWATFPYDGDTQQALLDRADAQLIARKAEHGEDDDSRPDWLTELGLTSEPTATDSSPLASAPADVLHARRTSLGASRALWLITAAMFTYFAAVCAVFAAVQQWTGAAHPLPLSPALMVLGFVIGGVILLSPAPALHTWRSELTLTLSYAVPAAAMLASSPHAGAVVGMGMFVGPLVAVRSTSRRHAAGHIATALLLAGAVGLLGGADIASLIAISTSGLTTFVLGVYCVHVLEACEAQGAELERLSELDPLTLLANRRRLQSALHQAVAAAGECAGEQVAVIALDLNGFKLLNDTVGHGAGDDLLVAVADELRAVAGADALCARPGGDEFVVVLRGQSPAAHEIGEVLRTRIGALRPSGCEISTGVGVAIMPDDGATPEALLRVADHRLLDDKYGPAHAPRVA